MLKVLNIAHSESGGGIQSVFKVTNTINMEGLKNFKAHGNVQDDSIPDIKLKRLSEFKNPLSKLFAYFFIPQNFFSIKRFLKGNEIDIIHLHSTVGLSVSLLLAIKKYKGNAKVILTSHGYGLTCPVYSCYSNKDKSFCNECILKGKESRVIIKSCDKRGRLFSVLRYIDFNIHRIVTNRYQMYDQILTPSDYSTNQLKISRHDFKNVDTLPNPIQFEKKKINYKQKDDEITFIGRFSEEKNVINLIYAFNLIAQDTNYNQVRLNILGDGKEKGKYLKIIKDLGLETRVTLSEKFLEKKDLIYYMKKSKVLALPTASPETFGLALLEGVRYSLIPVALNLGAQAENIRKLNLGYLCDNNDVEELAIVLKKAIDNYEEKIIDFKKANKIIDSEFSISNYHKNLYSFYKNIT